LATNPSNQLDQVIRYYESTEFDYRVTWLRSRTSAIHFGLYDSNASHHFAALENTNRIMADFAGIRPQVKVFDAGCGLGNAAFWLAKHRSAQVVGITPVPQQVEQCQLEANRLELDDRCTFIQGDYHAPGLEAEQFDVVWACESLCHSDQKGRFYKAAFDLLRPGGKLVIAEYMRQAERFSEADEWILDQWLSGWAIPDIETIHRHRSMATSAGFQEIRQREVTHLARVSLRNLFHHARRWLRFGKLLHTLGIRNDAQHANHEGAYFQFKALEKNLWGYYLLTAEKPSS
jgi:tocopherol O-methyltransferase